MADGSDASDEPLYAQESHNLDLELPQQQDFSSVEIRPIHKGKPWHLLSLGLDTPLGLSEPGSATSREARARQKSLG